MEFAAGASALFWATNQGHGMDAASLLRAVIVGQIEQFNNGAICKVFDRGVLGARECDGPAPDSSLP